MGTPESAATTGTMLGLSAVIGNETIGDADGVRHIAAQLEDPIPAVSILAHAANEATILDGFLALTAMESEAKAVSPR